MIKFHCGHCEQKLGVPDEYAGRRVRCNRCQQACEVPSAVEPVEDKITMQDILEEADESAKIEFEPAVQSEEFGDLGQLEEDPRQAAIRAARENRNQSGKVKGNAKKGKSDRQNVEKQSGQKVKRAMPSLADVVSETLRLPLGIGCSLLAVGVTVVIWILCSRATENALCFVALFVPMIGSMVLRLFTDQRTFVLGVLGIVIGGVGIVGGKFAIAQYSVIPYFEKMAHEEILVDMDALLANEKYQLEQKYSAKTYAKHRDFLYCCALASLVDEGQADPVKARALGVDTLRASNMTNIYTAIIEQGNEAYPSTLGELDAEDEAIQSQAWQRMFEWSEDELELRMTRKYFPALSRMSDQCELQRMLSKPDQTFQWALVSTFGIFDSLWIMLGLGLAYLSLAMD